MASMALVPSERPMTGLTLHRSEVIAHSMELLEKASSTKASTRARGREEGFACAVKGASPSFVPVILVPAYPFRPLGKPVDRETLTHINSAKLAEVHTSASAPEPRARRGAAERPAVDPGGPAEDGNPDSHGELEDGETDKDERKGSSGKAKARSGRDLHSYQSRRHHYDGFQRLRDSIRESESRVQQVKMDGSDTVCGLSHEAALMDCQLPPRERYSGAGAAGKQRPPGARASVSSSAGPVAIEDVRGHAGASGSLSARAPLRSHRQPPAPEPMASGTPRPPPSSARRAHVRDSASSQDKRGGTAFVRLPSLADFVARAGQPASGRAERRELAREREATNHLLGLQKELTLESIRSGQEGRGRMDFKRYLETPAFKWRGRDTPAFKKYLEGMSDDREVMENLEIRQKYNERAQAARREAEPQRGGGRHGQGDEHHQEEAVEGEDAEGSGTGDHAKLEALESDELGALKSGEDDDRPDVLERSPRGLHSLQDKVAKCFQRANAQQDRVREVLADYQLRRDKCKDRLLDDLQFMDDDRPNRVRQRLKPESGEHASPGHDERVRAQIEMHRELLQMAQAHTHKGSLDGVVHWMLDSVKHVLEFGEELQKEMLFEMLQKVEDFEFSALVSDLVVKMAKEVGLESEELLAWFLQSRGGVPASLSERLEGGGPRPALPATPDQQIPPASRAFLTEQE